MRRFPSGLLAGLALTLLSPAAWAAAVEGVVRTADGRPVPQLALVLETPVGREATVTGPEGRFRFAELPPGPCTVRVEPPGFVVSPSTLDGAAEVVLTLHPAEVREHVVVSAARGESAPGALGSSVSALDADEIASREPSSFLHLLQALPGVAVARSGGFGLQGGAFVRGGGSSTTRVLVDGVPVNEPGGAYDFAAALPLELERVELLRGAASSLYGTDAMSGVLQMVTRRASPDARPGLFAEAEGGSFAWRRALGGTSGRYRGLDWNLGAQHIETGNEAPNSAFSGQAGAASAGLRISDSADVRLVVRADSSAVGTPGPTAVGRPDLDASFERRGLIAGTRLSLRGERLAHAVQASLAWREQLSLNPVDSGPYTPRSGDHVASSPFYDMPDAEGFQNETRRLAFGYQLEAALGQRHLLTAGLDVERETGEIGSRSDPTGMISPERNNIGAYVEDRWLPAQRLALTLGARLERNDSFGTAFVPRATVAFRARGGEDATTLRASAGLGIKEPTFAESFGVSFYAQGNPGLEPERSRTFDAGVEQWLLGSRLRLEATVFHHAYRDQIGYQILDWTTYRGSYANLGRTRARGVEVAVDAAPRPGLRLSGRYTWLDGEVLESTSTFDPVYQVGQPLLRRPEHQASLGASLERGRLSGGADLVLVGRRADSHFADLGIDRNAAYTRLDARLRVRLGTRAAVFLAGENLLDADHEEVLGYPALGRSVRAGLRLSTGGSRP